MSDTPKLCKHTLKTGFVRSIGGLAFQVSSRNLRQVERNVVNLIKLPVRDLLRSQGCYE
jgi:hypothetical protein